MTILLILTNILTWVSIGICAVCAIAGPILLYLKFDQLKKQYPGEFPLWKTIYGCLIPLWGLIIILAMAYAGSFFLGRGATTEKEMQLTAIETAITLPLFWLLPIIPAIPTLLTRGAKEARVVYLVTCAWAGVTTLVLAIIASCVGILVLGVVGIIFFCTRPPAAVISTRPILQNPVTGERIQ